MPYYSFKEIRTPLALFGIKLYKNLDNGLFYIRKGNGKKTKLFK